MEKKTRAFELDLLRGIAIVMMVFQHISYDIRYEFGFDIFSYQEKEWFWTFVHPVILILFVGLSGICCTFSRNNLKRGIKLLAVSLAFTAVTYLVTNYAGLFCFVLFNVLHVLSVGILLYAALSFIEKKLHVKEELMTLIIGALGLYIILLNDNISAYNGLSDSWLLIPLGIRVKGAPAVADYLYIIPWLGVFLIGAVIGRTVYRERKTLFEKRAADEKRLTRPLEFMGRHSLIIYLAHQPLVYGILYLIFKLAGRI